MDAREGSNRWLAHQDGGQRVLVDMAYPASRIVFRHLYCCIESVHGSDLMVCNVTTQIADHPGFHRAGPSSRRRDDRLV